MIKTKRFCVLAAASQLVAAREVSAAGSVIVGGGRGACTVLEVARVAILGHVVQVDEGALEKMEKDRTAELKGVLVTLGNAELSRKLKEDRAAVLALVNGTSSSTRRNYSKELCRAAVFARIVSLMLMRSNVRGEVIELLADMLNAGVVPRFTSEAAAGRELVQVLSGCCIDNESEEEGDTILCYCGEERVMSIQEAFASADLSHVPLTAAEASTLSFGQFMSTGACCVIAAGAANLTKTLDAVAALACESYGAYVSEAFEADRFEVCRQHRGQISSASNMRLLLEGSKRINTASAPSSVGGGGGGGSEALSTGSLPFQIIPQVHGPAQEAVAAAVKSLELELNSSESGPITSSFSSSFTLGLDPSQSLLALQSIYNALAMASTASSARVSVLTGNVGIAPTSSSSSMKDLYDFPAAFDQLSAVQQALAKELSESNRLLGVSEGAAAGSSGGGGGGGAGGDEEASAAPRKGKPVIDESNYTPEQKAKAEAARKKKEEKAALKGMNKEAKKGGSGPALGAGTAQVRSFLNAKLAASGGPIKECDVNVWAVDPFNISEGSSLSVFCAGMLERLSSGGKIKPKVAKGTRDYGPEQMRIREHVFSTIRRVFKRHGGVEIDTPVFELKEVLTGKYGEDSKLIYDLADQGGELLSLRYDLTVPFARFLSMNSVGNIKRYHIAKVYRRDQPQLNRGRYREFYQCDFDIAGSFSAMVPDAEAITVATEILTELPVGKFLVKLNHRKILDAVFEISGVPEEKFRPICSAVDKLDKASWAEVRTEMVDEKGLPPHVADRIGEFVLHSGSPKELWAKLTEMQMFGDHQGAAGAMRDMQLLFEYLEAMGSLEHVSFDLSLARGLDYYTGVIYEIVIVDGVSQVGSIAAGGRYDNLVGMFSASGKQTPCVGVSIGIERVFTIMEKKAEEAKVMQASAIQVYIASIGSDTLLHRMQIAQQLWRADIAAEYSHKESPKLDKQMEETLERGIPFMIIFGKDELKKGVVKIKNITKRTEEEVSAENIVQALLADGCIALPATDQGFLAALRSSAPPP